MNAFSDFIQWRRRSKYLDSVDKKVKIFFGDRGIRNLTLIGVKQGKPAQNFDGEYIPKKRKIVINSELLDRAMDHDRGKELIVEVLVHECNKGHQFAFSYRQDYLGQRPSSS
jgi:hypothetical protein